jgi:hypothetical protein
MKYALHHEESSMPPQALGGMPRRAVQTGPGRFADAPLGKVDPQSLASTLDRLTWEVLHLNRPLTETWEQLRDELQTGAASGRH